MPAHAKITGTVVTNYSEWNPNITVDFGTGKIVYYASDTNIEVYNWNDNNNFKKYVSVPGGNFYFIKTESSYISTDNSESWTHAVTQLINLGDAKSILGSGSSSGLSEEQKTMIKDLIANGPGLCRLVEKFNERNDDNDEYEKT